MVALEARLPADLIPELGAVQLIGVLAETLLALNRLMSQQIVDAVGLGDAGRSSILA